jgi:hypothetical protein
VAQLAEARQSEGRKRESGHRQEAANSDLRGGANIVSDELGGRDNARDHQTAGQASHDVKK